MVAATRKLPASGYALEVDGRLKAEFATRDGARAGGEELKRRFPMLQIRIYDAETKAPDSLNLTLHRFYLCACGWRRTGLSRGVSALRFDPFCNPICDVNPF
jgi:hypothetical protein